MKTSLVSDSVVAMLAVAVSFLCVGRQSPERASAATANAEATKMVGRLPAAFVPNVGQWEHPARYVFKVGLMTVFLDEKGWTFTLVEGTEGEGAPRTREREYSRRGVAVRMAFAGASESELVAEDRIAGRHNYFLGNDPSKWRSDVPLYGALRYREIHPGIDVLAREHDGRFEYDLLLKPGADLDSIEIAVEGIERMHVDGQGALVMETLLGPVRMPTPLSWEVGPFGEKCPIACYYVLHAADSFGFVVPSRHPGLTLVVDPGLVWSTFLGGTSTDEARAVAVDLRGATTVAGTCLSANFPTTPGVFDPTHNNGHDAFVTRLSASGASLDYSTFLGGALIDEANALALDAQGAVTVAGKTSSTNFPTTPGAFDTSYGGGTTFGGDAFVARLSPLGSSLVYSTFLGGAGDDEVRAIALDAQGIATVAGLTDSSTFPTTPGAFDTSYNGGFNDAFVARLSPLGSSLVYSTFLGGTGRDETLALALDLQGAATVAGLTWSGNFPTTPGAFDTSFNGGNQDCFVTRLVPSGANLIYSTFLGGTDFDEACSLALDAQGAAAVVGFTYSANFPTTPGAFDTSFNGGTLDAFVTSLSPMGSSLVYSTFLGGAGVEVVSAIALDGQGAATVAGRTSSTNFPTTPGAFDTSYNGGALSGSDAFVTHLSPLGSSLLYSTFLGGAGDDEAHAIALEQGTVTVAGRTSSTDFPTTPGAFDTGYNGSTWDAFVTRLDMLPTGVTVFGNSSPGCNGPLAIWPVASVNSMPSVGNTSFALTCSNSSPYSVGLVAFSGLGLPAPLAVLGVEVWVDPTALLLTATVFSNAVGACTVPVPIPNNPTFAGVRLFAQFLWLGPNAPPPCPPLGFSASKALRFTIQP